MKICMVGLGSIGTRHLKNVTKVLKQRNYDFTIDAFRSSNSHSLSSEVKELISEEYFEADKLPSDYDVVFITNPTSLHYDTIKLFSDKTRNMFIEKPVFNRSDYNLENLNLKSDGIYYVACPMRYMNVTQYLKKFIEGKKIFSIRAICSTYLPDWRANVDYRKTYSASKDLGGGVSIDLIHEWDYLIYLFGKPQLVYNLNGTYSDLEITSDDLSVYIGKYKDKLISLHLDYFGRYSRREIELYLNDEVVVGDFIKNEISFLNQHKTISLSQNRNDYQIAEIEYFMDIINGKTENHNPLSLAINILKITKGDK